MSISRKEQEIKDLRKLVNQYREISRRFPEHEGYKSLIKKLEGEISVIGQDLLRNSP